jgi:hypothetical protein
MGVTTPPSLDAAPENEVTLATVLKEIKSVRSEVSALQQLVLQSGVTRSYPPPNQELNGFQPAPFLGPLADGIDPSQCFVIMPYSERWSKALEQILSEICRNESVKLSIAKNMDNRFIPHDIWRGITGSGLIIADLSGANPNVTYEVGLADVIGREVILIAQDKNVPFDFLAQRLILYEDSMAGMITLREELTKRLRAYNDTHRSDRQS